jgi:hypothetical protein
MIEPVPLVTTVETRSSSAPSISSVPSLVKLVVPLIVLVPDDATAPGTNGPANPNQHIDQPPKAAAQLSHVLSPVGEGVWPPGTADR